ncbi:MAG: hypothetical protein ACLTXL_12640 [Clostridia bacterium]
MNLVTTADARAMLLEKYRLPRARKPVFSNLQQGGHGRDAHRCCYDQGIADILKVGVPRQAIPRRCLPAALPGKRAGGGWQTAVQVLWRCHRFEVERDADAIRWS